MISLLHFTNSVVESLDCRWLPEKSGRASPMSWINFWGAFSPGYGLSVSIVFDTTFSTSYKGGDERERCGDIGRDMLIRKPTKV